jgi:hypothetical protein
MFLQIIFIASFRTLDEIGAFFEKDRQWCGPLNHLDEQAKLEYAQMHSRSVKSVHNGLLSLVHSASTPILHDHMPDISNRSSPAMPRRGTEEQSRTSSTRLQETAFVNAQPRTTNDGGHSNDGSFVTHISIDQNNRAGAPIMSAADNDSGIRPGFSLTVPAMPTPAGYRLRSDSISSVKSDGVGILKIFNKLKGKFQTVARLFGECVLERRLYVTRLNNADLERESFKAVGKGLHTALLDDIHVGRPNMEEILRDVAHQVFEDRKNALVTTEQQSIAVLSCGPEQMVDSVREMCRSKLGGKFDFHSERFTF